MSEATPTRSFKPEPENMYLEMVALEGYIMRLGRVSPEQTADRLTALLVLTTFVMDEATGCEDTDRRLREIARLRIESAAVRNGRRCDDQGNRQ